MGRRGLPWCAAIGRWSVAQDFQVELRQACRVLEQSVIEPQPDPGGTYETLFETYLSLYPATRELVGRLG